jgi:adenine-specific DNA glycosylase
LLIETKKPVKASELRKHKKEISLTINSTIKHYKHVLSHQQLIIQFIPATIPAVQLKGIIKKEGLTFYSKKEVEKLPKPIVINRFLKESEFLN